MPQPEHGWLGPSIGPSGDAHHGHGAGEGARDLGEVLTEAAEHDPDAAVGDHHGGGEEVPPVGLGDSLRDGEGAGLHLRAAEGSVGLQVLCAGLPQLDGAQPKRAEQASELG